MRRKEGRDHLPELAATTEDFYRHLVENSLGLICCHDFDGTLVMVNSAAARALGYEPEELTGRCLADFMPGELRPRFVKYLHRVTTFGQAHGYLTLVSKSGETVTWVYRNAVYGSSPLVIGHAQDITWRLSMERSLRESNEQFRALFEDAPVAYHELDARGTVVRVNNAECELLGRGKHEIIGRPVWELVVPDQREASRRDVERKLSGSPAPLKVVREYGLPDGRRLRVAIHDKLIRSAEGSIAGIRSTLLDVTEQFRIETELRKLNAELDRRVSERTAELNRSNERLKEFVYTVSHDLQEPLRAVIGFGELLRERYSNVLDQDGIEFIEFMTSGANRMSGLISDLLGYSRLLHDPAPVMQTVALADVFRLAEENLRNAISSAAAVITHDSLPVVTANQNRMIQLVQNLLSNAIKYSGGQVPRIHVSAERRPDEWVVSVTDNGIGIAEKDRERIFQLFRRMADSRTPGSGVGLAICRAIVHQHGGEIWVESTAGAGSRFRFSIPDTPACRIQSQEVEIR
jgi:PAS domain S-box-containing protein